MSKEKIAVFWFRRDLRLADNTGLTEALKGPFPVLPVFIFDTGIIDELERDDPRIGFIHERLQQVSAELKNFSASLCCLKGSPADAWKKILQEFNVQAVYANEDYEPYATGRDQAIKQLLAGHNIPFQLFKDQVIFAKDDVLKENKTPYTVYTPYKNKWLSLFSTDMLQLNTKPALSNFFKTALPLPSITQLGFEPSSIKVRNYNLSDLDNYEAERNFPAMDKTSYLSPHLRFGTVSIREVIKKVYGNQPFLEELIWREFFMQILYHFPHVVTHSFKTNYDHISWRNDPAEFEKWKQGKTGYPMVDAGMRELNTTGYMHNRVRMITASFLCKHLLIDWRWGEAYFAKKLLDYELSSNNGNWQWAAGSGCDAAPYFRVFNPSEQLRKFDPDMSYINKWLPEWNSLDYPQPVVDHKMARERAINTYKNALQAGQGK